MEGKGRGNGERGKGKEGEWKRGKGRRERRGVLDLPLKYMVTLGEWEVFLVESWRDVSVGMRLQ